MPAAMSSCASAIHHHFYDGNSDFFDFDSAMINFDLKSSGRRKAFELNRRITLFLKYFSLKYIFHQICSFRIKLNYCNDA